MKTRTWLWMFGALALAAPASYGQAAAPPGIPRLANGRPDFSGVWQKPYVADMTVTDKDPKLQSGPKELPFTEWGRQQFQSYKAAEHDFDKTCLPLGHLRSMNAGNPVQFLQNGNYLVVLYEKNNWFQSVPLDNRPHRDVEPAWFGDSVGHWEGDTLVVDTVNFNGLTNLDVTGHPHSDQLHLVQKLSFLDPTHLHYQVTITDPKAYTQSWTNDRTFTLWKGAELQEDSCEDNRASN